MAFVIGFVCFIFSCMFVLTFQVWNSRRIKVLENDIDFQKAIITELNLKLQHYEQEKNNKTEKGKDKESGQQAPETT